VWGTKWLYQEASKGGKWTWGACVKEVGGKRDIRKYLNKLLQYKYGNFKLMLYYLKNFVLMGR
jgi:hypothetical protein